MGAASRIHLGIYRSQRKNEPTQELRESTCETYCCASGRRTSETFITKSGLEARRKCRHRCGIGMIPRDYITEWRKEAPWVENFQVEQDLIISRALVDLFSHPLLSSALVLTCI